MRRKEPDLGTPAAHKLHFQDPQEIRFPRGNFLCAAIAGGQVNVLEGAFVNGWEAMMQEMHRRQ